MTGASQSENMGKEDRKRRVLRFLADTNAALPTAAIYRNVRLRGADFERRTLSNYLTEMVEDGHVEKIDCDAMEKGRIKQIAIDEDGYYQITDAGRELLVWE